MSDPRLARARSHPVRGRILDVLTERPASAYQLGEVLGEGSIHVSYHLKVLLELDCARIAKDETERGMAEAFYCATTRGASGSR
jgi:DNA-binding transcriptional ArsR family regulator